MDIYVLDKEFNVVDLIDTYTSVIWTTRYYTTGDFELYMPANSRLINTLKRDYYLVRDKDILQNNGDIIYENVMIVEKIQITTDVENKNFIIVSGRGLKSILRRRIIWQQTNLSGKAESGIRQIITENAIDPALPERKIQNLVLAEPINLPDTIDTQMTGDNLGEAIENICKTYNYGYDVRVVNKALEFFLYVGVDRSYNQTVNPYVIFSPEFENLLNTDYSTDSTDYKNVALVAGEGEGLDRKTVTVGTAAGLYRYEKYVDARDISTNDGEYTETEYNNMLSTRGVESLAENPVGEVFEGATETTLSYKLNEDYFLGDVVQVINEYQISTSPRILEVIESEDESGKTIMPTFSTWEV